MNEYFLNLVNVARKSKTAKDYIFKTTPMTKEDKIFIDANLKNEPPPQLILIKNGIEMSYENHKSQITIGSNIGDILFDGDLVRINNKSLKEQIESDHDKSAKFIRHPIFDMAVPRAEAQAFRMIGTLLWQTLKWSATSTVAGAAAGAGMGAGS